MPLPLFGAFRCQGRSTFRLNLLEVLLVTVDRELSLNDLNSIINVLAHLCENSRCGTSGMV